MTIQGSDLQEERPQRPQSLVASRARPPGEATKLVRLYLIKKGFYQMWGGLPWTFSDVGGFVTRDPW